MGGKRGELGDEKKSRKRKEGGKSNRRGERRRNKGSLCIDVGIVGERKKESKGKNCRSSTRRKGKDMEGRRE